MPYFVTETGSKFVNISTPQFIREKAVLQSSLDSRLNFPGQIACLGNAVILLGQQIQTVQKELICDHPDNFVVNGILFMVITETQHVLDGITSYCQRSQPLDLDDPLVYFDNYPFQTGDYSFIRSIQNSIKALKFNGSAFNSLANETKHGLPWIGTVSFSGRRSFSDIFDDKGVGVIHDMIVPIYKPITQILTRLNNLFTTSQKIALSFPSV